MTNETEVRQAIEAGEPLHAIEQRMDAAENAANHPEKPEGSPRKKISLSRGQQRALEDWLVLVWPMLDRSRPTKREAVGQFLAAHADFPAINENHLDGALRALGKTWPSRRRVKRRISVDQILALVAEVRRIGEYLKIFSCQYKLAQPLDRPSYFPGDDFTRCWPAASGRVGEAGSGGVGEDAPRLFVAGEPSDNVQVGLASGRVAEAGSGGVGEKAPRDHWLGNGEPVEEGEER